MLLGAITVALLVVSHAAATCNPGTFLTGSGLCAECWEGFYCVGDTVLQWHVMPV